MNKINSRAKGGRVERLVVDWLKENGCPSARRSVQYCGRGGESADVLCDELSDWHIEVKGTASASVPRSHALKWYEQVKSDCPQGKKPILIHVPNNHAWSAWKIYEKDSLFKGRPQIGYASNLNLFNPSAIIESMVTVYGVDNEAMPFPLNTFKEAQAGNRYGWLAFDANFWLTLSSPSHSSQQPETPPAPSSASP